VVNRWHLAAVYLLVWGAGFLGVCLGCSYIGESYTFYQSSGITSYNTFYWKVGGCGGCEGQV
jgi:hypothetical protein